jgi:hypothetical protein
VFEISAHESEAFPYKSKHILGTGACVPLLSDDNKNKMSNPLKKRKELCYEKRKKIDHESGCNARCGLDGRIYAFRCRVRK